MTQAEEVAASTREGVLYEALDEKRIRCFACSHQCPIPDGFSGVCKVRFNRRGRLQVPYGYTNTIRCDPIEKKPFFHAIPGSNALSFGMLGCCLHCAYCQNWISSQALRDPNATLRFNDATPEAIVRQAILYRASSIISTYNEPLITAEWAAAVFRHAHSCGFTTGFVSNGQATPRVLAYLRPWVDLFKVDLKTMNDRRYRELGGRLKPVLESIEQIHQLGFWLEIVTLLIPGFNDSTEELSSLARFITSVSPDIPWHVTAFRKDYRMQSFADTDAVLLVRAASIARESGLRFVYAGNLPGETGNLENTYCPNCSALLIQRRGFVVYQNRMLETGACPHCNATIPGHWKRVALRPKEATVVWNGHGG